MHEMFCKQVDCMEVLIFPVILCFALFHSNSAFFCHNPTQLNPELGQHYFPMQNHNHKPHQTNPHFFSAPTQPNSTKFSMQPYFNPTRRFMPKKIWCDGLEVRQYHTTTVQCSSVTSVYCRVCRSGNIPSRKSPSVRLSVHSVQFISPVDISAARQKKIQR